MTTVYRWTGREAKLLRQALRFSVRDFAARLGVGIRTVNRWEARQAGITPLPYMQQVLDTALERASEEVKARFAEGVLLTQRGELVVAQQEGAASRSEPSQAGHCGAASACATSQQWFPRSLDPTRLVSRSTMLGVTRCCPRRGISGVPSRR